MPSKIAMGIGYSLGQLPALAYAWGAFKMHEDPLGADVRKPLVHEKLYDKSWWDTVFLTPVCPFGKLGAMTVLGWIVGCIAILFTLETKLACMVVGIVSIIMYSGMLTLSLLLNWPLHVRSVPFFMNQLGLCMMLLTLTV